MMTLPPSPPQHPNFRIWKGEDVNNDSMMTLPPSPPRHPNFRIRKGEDVNNGSSDTVTVNLPPLKAASVLIQNLNIAHTQVQNSAADAAAAAENARRNSRTAQEIARRYMYPITSAPAATSLSDCFGIDTKLSVKELKYPVNDTKDPMNRNSITISSSSDTGRKSFERIAQHHADDVLKLQSSLTSLQSKYYSLEKMNEKLVQDFETKLQLSAKKMSALGQQLGLSRLRLEAAEEDAQLALDLAKDSAEQRDQMEDCLKQKQKEIEFYESHQRQLTISETSKQHVRFATDIDTSDQEKNEEQASFEVPSRSIVAAGRQVLRRNILTSSTSSTKDSIIRLDFAPTKSVERLRRLNKQLNKSNEQTNLAQFSSSSPSHTPPISPSVNGKMSGGGSSAIIPAKLEEEYHTAIKILQASGKRLNLDGYWWREQSKTSHNSFQIDIMIRQYCQSIEFKIDRQQKDINQLESLCHYLEKKLVLDDQPSC